MANATKLDIINTTGTNTFPTTTYIPVTGKLSFTNPTPSFASPAPARYYTDYGSFSIYKLPDLDQPFYHMMSVYAAQALEFAWASSLAEGNEDCTFLVFENITGVIMGIFKNGGTIKFGYGANWLMENHRDYYVSG